MLTTGTTGTMTSVDDWIDVFTGLHGASTIHSTGGAESWASRLDCQQSNSFGLARCTGGDEVVTRRARHIATDPRGMAEVLVPLAGTAWVSQGDEVFAIGPGVMAVCDTDQPMKFAHGADFRSISLVLPAQLLDARRTPTSHIARTGALLNGTTGMGRLARSLVVTMDEERGNLTEPEYDLSCERLLDMFCLIAEGGASTAPTNQRAAVEAEVRRHVREHAAEPDLNVDAIARALGWSARYIQQLLHDSGTTAAELIRTERLHLARLRLASPGWAGWSIGQISHACGFGSHASFSTAFRAAFGASPREFRGGSFREVEQS